MKDGRNYADSVVEKGRAGSCSASSIINVWSFDAVVMANMIKKTGL